MYFWNFLHTPWNSGYWRNVVQILCNPSLCGNRDQKLAPRAGCKRYELPVTKHEDIVRIHRHVIWSFALCVARVLLSCFFLFVGFYNAQHRNVQHLPRLLHVVVGQDTQETGPERTKTLAHVLVLQEVQ
uniref:Uncharacterized protein n=1 Tax=Anopheles culicifacies TaxID=139723 RepID=A0A182M0W5_9DIPT